MSWRDEILLDHQFFGAPGNPGGEAQQKIVAYAASAVGGVLTTLNFIYFLRKEIEKHMPEIAEGLGLTSKEAKGVKDVKTGEGTIPGNHTNGDSL